jgi:protease-4
MVAIRGIGRLGIVLLAAVVGVAAGWFLFVEWGPDPLRVLLLLATAGLLTWVGGNLAGNLLSEYNVAEVEVAGPITRDGGSGPLPTSPATPGADDVVEQIERADGNTDVDALLVKLNTPGGAVLPSDDIRTAAQRFDGPTIAYATDLCASGGYWIASGCDELWARDLSIVGSIGVIGPQVDATDLAEKLGVDFEYVTAGEYKDAGRPFAETTDADREYLQDRVDEQYDAFVERAAEGRGLDPEVVRDTEARVYTGENAEEMGLVDELGDREAIEERLEDELRTDVEVREFTPQGSIGSRITNSAQSVAYAAGAGLASVLDVDDDVTFELR